MPLKSYQCTIKIIGMQTVAEREAPEQTAQLWLKLFSALGVQNVSISNIDAAHLVPSRSASDRPNAIVFKFVRQLRSKQ